MTTKHHAGEGHFQSRNQSNARSVEITADTSTQEWYIEPATDFGFCQLTGPLTNRDERAVPHEHANDSQHARTNRSVLLSAGSAVVLLPPQS